VKPLALPPGRAKLETKPAPTGSTTFANTIGTERVVCSSGSITTVALSTSIPIADPYVPVHSTRKCCYTTCKMIPEHHCKMICCKKCILVPEEKSQVLHEIQERMPYGLAVQDIDEALSERSPLDSRQASS
jgi:hypothetical protein